MKNWLERFFGSRGAAPLGEGAGTGQDDHYADADAQSSVLERDAAIVSGHRSVQSRVNQTLAMLFFGALGVSLLSWYYGRLLSHPDSTRRSAEAQATARAEGDTPLPPLNWPITPPAAPPSTTETRKYAIGSILGPVPDGLSLGADSIVLAGNPIGPLDPNGTGQAPRTPAQLLEDRQLSGAVFSHSATPVAAVGPNDGGAFPLVPTSGSSSVTTALGARLHAETTPAVRASLLPTQRLLLPKGALVDCTLETAIDSTLPGLTTCLTAVDTFSADGTVVLMERGTKLVGETQGDAEQGRSRLFVLWTEARTPAGIVIPLDSPGTDELGRSGLSGHTNRHFLERFGAAMLVTMIDGAVQGAVSRSSNDTVIINSTAVRDVGTEVLRNTLAIPPTITVKNGQRLQILVARDLDFRSVYELHAK